MLGTRLMTTATVWKFVCEWVNFENKNSPSLSFSFWSCWALWKITLYYHSWTIIHFLELLGNPRFACEEVKNCGCSSTKILLAHHSLTELIMPTIIQLSRFCRTLYKWKCGLILYIIKSYIQKFQIPYARYYNPLLNTNPESF